MIAKHSDSDLGFAVEYEVWYYPGVGDTKYGVNYLPFGRGAHASFTTQYKRCS